MRSVIGALVLFLAAGLVGCANVPRVQDEQSPVVTVGCTNSLTPVPDIVSLFDWELVVSTDEPIESGEAFIATLDGVAVVSESLLDQAQAVIPGGVSEVNLVDLNATVHVRDGATGPDVTLAPEAIPYECFIGSSRCDPDRDLEGVPGVRGNSDCQPEGPGNPCGRFIRVQTSTDCSAGGTCSGLQKALQCDLHRFCITGDLQIPLKAETQAYTADVEADEVLFGWADESTGATIKQDDPNFGTWILPEAVYDEGPGPVGFRTSFSGVLRVAFECAMGVDSTGPLGVNSTDPLSSPTPDDALISLPIQMEVL